MISCPIIRFTGVLYEKLLKHEKIVFSVFLLISLLQLWLTKYVPSLDGPQHLYNANVLTELLKGNELFHQFFKVNDVIVGYWTGHFFLTFFKFFFPAWLAEKLFLTSYVLAMVFSFRFLVTSLNKTKGNFVSYLIFPFIYHSYLLMGYYSFSIAAIFFFLGFAYWIRHHQSMDYRHIGVFALILLGLFLSHGLVFVLFGLTFIIYFLSVFLYNLFNKEEFSLKKWLGIALKTLVAVLPALILWIIYIKAVMSVNNAVAEPSYTKGELINFLMRIRQLVGFHHEMESVGYIPLFVLMVLLSIVFLVIFIPGLKDKTKHYYDIFDHKNAWIFVALAFLGLYFFAPDRISAGSLTNRFGLFFFLAFISWLSFQKTPKTFQVLSVVVILFSITYTRIVHHNFYVKLNRDISDIEQLADGMEENSVIHYQQASRNWTHLHFQLYAAVDKPIVHLKNPQCRGQFPVEWNLEALPRCYAGPKEVSARGAKRIKGIHYPVDSVDYITVFYKDQYFNDSTNLEWWDILDQYYEETLVSERGRAALYRRIH